MSAYHRHLGRTKAIQRERRAAKNDVPCWCGEPHPWFSEGGLRPTCGGAGEVECLCGGDFCACHNHGSIDCCGCPDCEWGDPDDDYDLDDYDLDDERGGGSLCALVTRGMVKFRGCHLKNRVWWAT